ncbi:MAG: chitobiase/beta-hexosaminidase C-terminal domain-containing protein [Thermoguttaceae bacterium]|jgi:hypothetical protein
MKATSIVLPLIFLVFTAASAAQDKPGTEAVDRFVLTKVRLLPKPGTAGLLAGVRITGSNEGPTTAFVELARINRAGAGDGWLEVAIRPDPQAGAPVYRFVKIESAKGAGLALAEIEFYSPAGRLGGSGFGTSVGNAKSATAFDKALDGDPKTFFESTAENSYVGIDLGSQAQAPTPHFNPQSGASAAPQKIEIGTWPPGTTIHYTTDGSPPTSQSGQLYRGPITVSTTTSIAAIATREGLADSGVTIATYRIGAAATAQQQVKSYHLGNSLTDTISGFLEPIADSAGKNLLFMRKSVPGCSIGYHWEHNRAGFASPDWWANDYNVACAKGLDHLFLQPFPNPPGLDADGAYGGKFIELARKHNPRAEIWLYAQWPDRVNWKRDAYSAPHPMNPPWFPPNRHPANWEEAVANNMAYYLDLKKIWDKQIAAGDGKPVRVCPGGPALVRLKKEIDAGKVPGISTFFDTMFADDIHLSSPGRYLVALVHYACIFGESPQGKVTFANSGLTREQAAVFQRIAWQAVTAEPLTGVRP